MALPYAINALEPVISRQTLEFHHGKHLAGYVNNLNALLEGSPLAGLPLEEIVLKATGGMLNNAGQILNHNLYFEQYRAPKADNAPTGPLADAIVRDFGSFELRIVRGIQGGVPEGWSNALWLWLGVVVGR